MSSFNGKIQEIPGICVDNFENPQLDDAKSYFLSHFHSDHTVGLDSHAFRKKVESENNVYIYATKMTCAIIVHKNPHLKDYVKVLQLGSNLISIPSKEDSELIINVTLIPAGHCLGSTMFLFETTTAKILYTGDFRIRPNDLSRYAAFHDKNKDVIKLDALYVDTTFLNTKHENFPKRSESIQEVIELIRGFLDSHEDQFVILNTSAYYGYEYVFNMVYESLGIKVYVDDKRWTFYSTVQNIIKGVTNNPHDTRVFLASVPGARKPLLPPKIIRFSAMRWEHWKEDMASVEENKNITYVCFATHCSKHELISFVEYMNPNKVIGFPFEYTSTVVKSSEAPVEKFLLSPKKSPKKQQSLRKSLRKDKKVPCSVLKQIFGTSTRKS